MATISNNEIARAIYLAARDKNKSEQQQILRQIVHFLFRRRILHKSSDILARLSKIINQEEGRIVAKVSSPERLDPKTKTHLEHALKSRYKVKEVILEEGLDNKLIGGIKIEANDEVIDLSVKNRMEKLKAYLNRN